MVFPSFGGNGAERDAASAPSAAPRRPAGPSPAEIEAIRERARVAGLETGMREGRAQAYAEWTARLDAGARALDDAARHLLASRVELAAEIERQMPRLVFALARKVLRDELSHAQTAAQTVIRGVCERLAGCERPVTVRLAPEAAAAFDEWARSEEGAAAGVGVRVETDPRLGPGDFMLETEDGFLDGRVESQLDAAWRLVTELPRP